MADLALSNIQNQLIAEKALQVLNARRSPLTLFSNLISEDVNATALYVPYVSGLTANRGFGGTSSGTLNGQTVTFGEPYVSTTTVTPNILTSGFTNLITNIIPAQTEAVMTAIEQTLYGLINTTLPQISGSTATVAMIDSGSNVIRTSGSFAPQITLAGDKFDTQLKAALSAANIYVQANILNGQYVNSYNVNNSTVLPTSNLATYATGSDAATLIADSIVWATKPVDVRAGSVGANYYGIQFSTYLDEDPSTHKLFIQTAAQVAMGIGRQGFGARLKVN